MVEETIEAIRKAETEAERILTEASGQCTSILEEARESAAQKKATAKAAAVAAAAAEMAAAQSQGTVTQEESQVQLEREVAAMRELVSQREKEAVELVLAGL